MYNDIIKVIQEDLEAKMENEIVAAVQKCGIYVDKEELIKALNYDRKSYEKGYVDGYEAAQAVPSWIPIEVDKPDEGVRVLIQLDNGWMVTAYYEDNQWYPVPDWGEDMHNEWVEAWMPLPEGYKGEDGVV